MHLVGAGMHHPRFDSNRILLNELVITGANTYDHDGFEQALALLASGKLPIEHLVEEEEVSYKLSWPVPPARVSPPSPP